MTRYRLTLEYDGGPYRGFQVQGQDLPSVQGALQKAILAFCGEAPRIHVAGRTDTGVHATAQVCHIDLEKDWPARTVREAINAHLVPEPVVVIEAEDLASAKALAAQMETWPRWTESTDSRRCCRR